MFRLLVCHFQNKPEAGLAGTGGSFIAGAVSGMVDSSRDDILFWFQILAFTATILVGLITAYAQIMKMRRMRKNELNHARKA